MDDNILLVYGWYMVSILLIMGFRKQSSNNIGVSENGILMESYEGFHGIVDGILMG